MVTGGVMAADDGTPEESAKREVSEELGIKMDEIILHYIETVKFSDETINFHCYVYALDCVG